MTVTGAYLAATPPAGVETTSGIDWIRHILQVVVAVVAIGGVSALPGRKSSV
jgi:hypothetical protein